MNQFFADWGGHILSAISIIFTAVTFFLSLKSYKLQNHVNELDAKIKKYELAKIEREKEEAEVFNLCASIYRIGEDFRLKISNIGKRTAYNVSAKIDGGVPFLWDDKMPFEELESQRYFEERLAFYDSAPHKFKVILTWQDENAKEYCKTQMCSI